MISTWTVLFNLKMSFLSISVWRNVEISGSDPCYELYKTNCTTTVNHVIRMRWSQGLSMLVSRTKKAITKATAKKIGKSDNAW